MLSGFIKSDGKFSEMLNWLIKLFVKFEVGGNYRYKVTSKG